MQEHQTELIEQRGNTVPGQVVNALFELADYPDTLDTIDTADTQSFQLINVSASDISDKLDIKPQVIGLILRSLGVKTAKKRIGDKTKRLVIYDEVLFETLRRRYMPNDDVPTVPDVANHMVDREHDTKTTLRNLSKR